MRVRAHTVVLVVLMAALFSPAAVNAPAPYHNTVAQPTCVSTAIAAAHNCGTDVSCLEGVLDSLINCLR